MKQNYNSITIIISNSQIKILFSYSRSTNGNVNMSFPRGNFEGNSSTYVFGKSFWHYRELKSDCWTSRHILCEKNILNSFVCVEIKIVVEKWNLYEGHNFSEAITTHMQIGNDFLEFKYPVNVKKFSNSNNFYWN